MVTRPVADSQIPYLLDRIAELERANKNYLGIMRIMAHDRRNPLGGITSLAETLLADKELSAESLVMLNLIKTAGIQKRGISNVRVTLLGWPAMS
jgi:nitrogen-specific signal transduction histidine kinase